MDDHLQGYLDESNKPVRDRATGRVSENGNYYVVGAAVVFKGHQEQTRRALRQIAQDLGCDLHYNDLSPARRVAAIEAILAIDTWDGYLFETANPIDMRSKGEHRARAHTMGQAFMTLSNELDIKDLVLESRSKPSSGFVKLDQNDHHTLNKLKLSHDVPTDLRIRHDTKDEPLLWIADLLAGARTDWLCHTSGSDMYPLLGHRVELIVSVLRN